MQTPSGESQTIHRVTEWPGQEAGKQHSKIPTLAWYDTNGRVHHSLLFASSVQLTRLIQAMAFGAEAQLDTIQERAEDNSWVLVKHFRLHLNPKDIQANHDIKIESLPLRITLQQIYSDFLRYLVQHTRKYMEDRILQGKQLWQQLSPRMNVVFTHPNGWGVGEQEFLRSVAVSTRLSNANQASSRVQFVTESEALACFYVHHTNLGNILRPEMNFAICNAGDSTTDTTLYSVTSSHPIIKFEEKRAMTCLHAGSIFVNFEVEKFLRKTFTIAELDLNVIEEYAKAGTMDFESFAKLGFKDPTTDCTIRIAGSLFNNVALRVRRGRMFLPGLTVKGFFEGSLKQITESVDQQLKGIKVPYILLVGSFGNIPYIRNEFMRQYESRGSQIIHTSYSPSNAIADGALVWNMT
ncbi:unnamed protein product [Rhizoctonia solani]|uniref:Uncharacterized protein n=1 Tax=Rhizoctonia solani TaxID=456999 RepID=A0A8H3AF63_9AGAM|nr:unnamed protein product [Rhizoctonia solani]